MEELFKKREDNIFETHSGDKKLKRQKSRDLYDDTTEDSSKFTKLVIKMKTEYKNRKNTNFFLEGKEDKDEDEDEEEKKEEEKEENINTDEYAYYGRIDKTGIHFQIISDNSVSIEFFPKELLKQDIKDLINKYKGVYDKTMKLWIIPYMNYESFYNELSLIERINTKLHKVGSIAKKCYKNKKLETLIIKGEEKEEKINYSDDDISKRDIKILPEEFRKKLYDFQKEGIKFGIEHHCRYLLADDMGLGKTIQAISLAYIYQDSWPVLIVCPKSMKYLWKEEIQKWLGFEDKRFNIINTSKQKISKQADFYIINYDLVRHIRKKLKKMTFNFVILDEAHSIRKLNSSKAENILPIEKSSKRLILISGTPLLSKPLEAYPLLYALRPDLFHDYNEYAYRYCQREIANTKELHWILSTLMVRRLKKDVLKNLPKKYRQKVEISVDHTIIPQIEESKREGTLEAYTLTAKAKIEGVCQYISDILVFLLIFKYINNFT